MTRLRFAVLALAIAGVGIACPRPLHAQVPTEPSVQRMATALQNAKQAHLWRVGVWGGVNTLGGLALIWGTSRARRSASWHFGAMSAGWGAVNTGIATVGLLTMDNAPTDPTAVLAAERQFHDILLFNLGLNVAYAAVGATMLGAGYRGVSNAGRWRGFGTSLILQGAGLLVLDGIVFFASRTRLGTLLAQQTDLALHLSPSQVTLTLHF